MCIRDRSSVAFYGLFTSRLTCSWLHVLGSMTIGSVYTLVLGRYSHYLGICVKLCIKPSLYSVVQMMEEGNKQVIKYTLH